MSTKFQKLKALPPKGKKRLLVTLALYFGVMLSYLAITCGQLLHDNLIQPENWKKAMELNSDLKGTTEEIRQEKNPVMVSCGTYLENIKKIDFKNNTFDGNMMVWFRWEGSPELDMADHFRIYKGEISKKELVTDFHRDGVNYQKVRISYSITKNYKTPRFPLGSYQLHIYVEPDYRCDQVQLLADKENSVMNGGLEVSGYKVARHEVTVVPIRYPNDMSDPELSGQADEHVKLITTELMTAVEITRDGIGTYVKCFIALFATTLWVLITLYLCTAHEVDPLGMIPSAFFGAVSNIMVGANLLPDALQPGLIEYVNIWGILNILSCTMMIISINSIRKRYQEPKFAKLYGKIVFWCAAVTIAAGNILLPLVCVL